MTVLDAITKQQQHKRPTAVACTGAATVVEGTVCGLGEGVMGRIQGKCQGREGEDMVAVAHAQSYLFSKLPHFLSSKLCWHMSEVIHRQPSSLPGGK